MECVCTRSRSEDFWCKQRRFSQTAPSILKGFYQILMDERRQMSLGLTRLKRYMKRRVKTSKIGTRFAGQTGRKKKRRREREKESPKRRGLVVLGSGEENPRDLFRDADQESKTRMRNNALRTGPRQAVDTEVQLRCDRCSVGRRCGFGGKNQWCGGYDFSGYVAIGSITPRYLVLLDQGTCVLCKYNFGGSFLMWCEKKTASVFATLRAIFQVENQSSSLAMCLCKK
ncbi:hypothetical protein TNCV_3523751 [Trichonephila clavipes]|uniref:Uncharacterized protein n=1 Tax=Trichonephila clavipes TaxID=2585209 RepID=A0A8X6VGI6_TRICX|nr:hypothetical protein TNCV_3523751 [Trichonephila clavipes]